MPTPFGHSAALGRLLIAFALTTALAADAQALLSVQSEPSGATLTIDGQPAGRTPLVGLPLVPGRHLVSARLSGLLATSRKVDLQVEPLLVSLLFAGPASATETTDPVVQPAKFLQDPRRSWLDIPPSAWCAFRPS